MPKRVEGRTNVRVVFQGEELVRFETVKKHYGIEANAELVKMLLKREYDQIHGAKPRFEHVNPKEGYPTDHVSILDRELRPAERIVSVYFKRDKGPFCDYDQTKECVHVDYAWEIPEVAKVLRAKGLEGPGRKN